MRQYLSDQRYCRSFYFLFNFSFLFYRTITVYSHFSPILYAYKAKSFFIYTFPPFFSRRWYPGFFFLYKQAKISVFTKTACRQRMSRTLWRHAIFIKLPRGLEPPTSALPRRRATDCATAAYIFTTNLYYYSLFHLSMLFLVKNFRSETILGNSLSNRWRQFYGAWMYLRESYREIIAKCRLRVVPNFILWYPIE